MRVISAAMSQVHGTANSGSHGSAPLSLRSNALCGSQLVEQHASLRFAAIFVPGYWAGLRISEIAALRLDQCHINQRAGSITLLDAKGGKTRTLDLHNLARRALYEYLFPERPRDRDRDEESVYVFTSQRAAWLRQQGREDSSL